jgi:ABC-type transport system substrate-binding protein
MERMYDDPERALAALERGEIDILDHVFPGDLPALVDDSNLAVSQYSVPTTHVVIFREKPPYLANRTFRRGLAYGLNREAILHQGLLKGQDYPGYGVISGPFPAPLSGSESPAYGYDQQIEPRPYDPRLGLTLRIVGQNEVKGAHDKLEKPVPPLTPIVLGHPADETARIACRAIAAQWKLIGVETKLVEFPPGIFDDAAGECDAVYLEAALWEPIVDAARLLGPEGLAPSSNGFIQLTLRQIEQATSWQLVRQRFRQLHRQLHEDVTLLPLFQTQDHYAYRKSLTGLSAPRVTLYENVEEWQVAPRLARANP